MVLPSAVAISSHSLLTLAEVIPANVDYCEVVIPRHGRWSAQVMQRSQHAVVLRPA